MAEGLATMEIERGHTSSVDCASNAQDDEEGDAEQGEHRAQAEEGSVRNMTGEVPATGGMPSVKAHSTCGKPTQRPINARVRFSFWGRSDWHGCSRL